MSIDTEESVLMVVDPYTNKDIHDTTKSLYDVALTIYKPKVSNYAIS
jgi:hypothetical protein